MTELTETLADQINRAHDQAQDHAKRAIEHALECGDLLLEAKAKCKHGAWLPWLKANTSIPERTASHYMRLADNRKLIESKSATVADLTVNGALKLLGRYTYHDAATIYAWMTDEEFESLVENIKAEGLLNPITLYEGKILDGRCRYEACLLAGVEPEFIEYEGNEPYGYAFSANLLRNHLTVGQRAAVAAELLPKEAEQ